MDDIFPDTDTGKIDLTEGLSDNIPDQVIPIREGLTCLIIQDSSPLSAEHVPRETRADLPARETCLYPLTPLYEAKVGDGLPLYCDFS